MQVECTTCGSLELLKASPAAPCAAAFHRKLMRRSLRARPKQWSAGANKRDLAAELSEGSSSLIMWNMLRNFRALLKPFFAPTPGYRLQTADNMVNRQKQSNIANRQRILIFLMLRIFWPVSSFIVVVSFFVQCPAQNGFVLLAFAVAASQARGMLQDCSCSRLSCHT